MKNQNKLLGGGDLRSLAKSKKLIAQIHSQKDFDELFAQLRNPDRLIRMRAADVIEKITTKNPNYLKKHGQAIISMLSKELDKEFKWHMAQISSRLDWRPSDLKFVWSTLAHWALGEDESKIVRVNSIQALYDLATRYPALKNKLRLLRTKLLEDTTPSIVARIKKLEW